jgi:hypothetical protein
VVIWKNEGGGGKLMSWRPQGLTDHGAIVVQALDLGDQWQLEVRVPGWYERSDQWRENAMQWIGLNALKVDEAGIITVGVKITTPENTEMNLARMASLIGATAMAAAYLRSKMGLERTALERAAETA